MESHDSAVAAHAYISTLALAERSSQLDANARRKLRHPSRPERLRSFMDAHERFDFVT
jgi:hypothetical protein